MSTTIDQKVVEMRFDNKHFEKNVSTTMSTLDKLKHALRLDGSTKGLENIGSAAKKVDLSGVSKGVDTVQAKFSALEVMGVTALANITNSAVNAGKRIVSALTIDPVKTGLSEYEIKMNAIQTIQANTRGKNSMEDITKALDELNEYADQTIYNFAQMTSNVGKFTAQGFSVQDATNAIKGIANLAAASGASAEDMSRATYQMSQAMGASIKLMDWNSLRNANMATQDLKNTLIELARVHDIAIDDMIEKEGTFEYTLQNGWLTGELFTKAMNIYSGVYSEAELAGMGFTQSQIANFQDLAKTAQSAATEVKTFTQLWDVLKETAQSGWTQTWEIIFGDFDTAKATFTALQVYFSDIINGWSDLRNSLFGGALNMKSPWATITEKLKNSDLFKVVEKVENVTDKLEEFQKVVRQVWRGDYGNSDTGRFEALEELGYHSEVIQDLVNKGENYKLTVEDIEASYRKFGLELERTKVDTDALDKSMNTLTEEQLRNAGLTEGEIRLYMALSKEAEKTGKSVSELAKEMSELDGRTMMVDAIKNVWSGLVSVFTAVREAWLETFPPVTVVQLYKIVTKINELSLNVAGLSKRSEDFKRVFKGLFALLDIAAYLIGGPLKVGFEILKQILGAFNLDILDGAATIGDILVKFRDWIKSTLDFSKAFEKIAPTVLKVVDVIRTWFSSVTAVDSVPRQLVQGFVDGLKSGVSKVAKVVWDFGEMILSKLREVFGIHSPARKTFEMAVQFIQGFINGIKSTAMKAWNALKSFGNKCLDILKDLDFGKILVGGLLAGSVAATLQISKAIANVASAFEGLGDMFEGIGALFKGVKNYLNSAALINMAIAIGILAASLLMLSFIPAGKLWNCVAVITVLSALVVGLTFVMSKLGEVKAFSVSPKAILSLVAVSGAMLLLALAMAKLTKIKISEIGTVIISLGILIASLMGIMAVCKNDVAIKMGGTILAMSASLILIVAAIKMLSKISLGDALKGLSVVVVLESLMIALIAITAIAGDNAKKAGAMMLMISFALLIMAKVIKQLSKLEAGGVIKAFAIILLLKKLFVDVVLLSAFAGANAAKAGAMLLMMSGAFLIMSVVLHILSTLKIGGVIKGLIIVSNLTLLFAGIIAMSLLAGPNAMKAGVLLLAMSGALMILSGVLYILSLLDTGGLAKGTIIVLILGSMLKGLIAVAKDVPQAMGSLIVLTIAIGLLGAIIIAMSFLDTGALLKSTAIMSLTMLSLAALLKSFKTVNKFTSALKAVGAMVILVGAVAAIFTIMSALKVDNALENSAAISLLMLSMAATLKIMRNTRKIGKAALVSLGVMTAIATALGLIIAMMSGLKTANALENTAALSILMLTLVGTLYLLKGIKTIAVTGLASLAIMTAIAALVALVLAEMSALDIQNGIENATALSILLIGLSAACLVVSAVGTIAAGVIPGIGALAVFITALAGILILLGSLGDEAAQLIDKGIPVLKSLGTGLGEFIGGFIGGVFEGAILDTLPKIGQALADFMTNIQPFIDGAKTVGWDVLKGITALSAAIIELSAAQLISGILTLNGLSLVPFGASLSGFMKGAKVFLDEAANIDPESMNGVKSLAEAILALTAANVINGISKWIPLSGSIVGFGAELAAFGPFIKQFGKSVEGIKPKVVTAAANAGKALAEMASAIPNGVGLLDIYTGSNDLVLFGYKLKKFGEAIKEYASIVGDTDMGPVKKSISIIKDFVDIANSIPNTGGLSVIWGGDNNLAGFGRKLVTFGAAIQAYSDYAADINVTAVDNSMPAVKAIIEIANLVPPTGGIKSWFDGENRYGAFGRKLASFAEAMYDYSLWAAMINTAAINTSRPAVQAIIKIANLVPPTGGIKSWFDGENRYGAFGKKISSFGAGVKLYSDAVADVDNDAISKSRAAVLSVIEIAKNIPESGGLKGIWSGDGNYASFGNNMASFGFAIKRYSNSVADINITAIHDSNKAVGKVIDLVKNAASADFSKVGDIGTGITKLAGALTKYAKVDASVVGDIVDDMKELHKAAAEIAKTNFGEYGEELIVNFANGISSKDSKSKIKKAVESIIDSLKKNLKTESAYSKFESVGSYLMDGLIAGINSKRASAVAAASAIAAAVSASLNAAFKINSPSKVTMKTGEGVVEGLVLGIHNLFGDAEHAGEDLAGRAASGLSGAISKLQDAVSMDFDAIQPVISPVLDLDAVSDGARNINGMFGIRPSVGVLANVQSVSATMGRRQNGNSTDVASALKDLGRKFDKKTGDTYNINGITYDDGSNVATAVKTLVRAARVERRT